MTIDLRTLIHELVGTDSVSGEESTIATWAESFLGAHGLPAHRVGDSVIARFGGAGPSLLLLTHLDTVPVGEGWTRDPRGEWDGDTLYGRGANDAKASAAAMIAAAIALHRDGPRDGGVWLALAAREETDNGGAREILAAIDRPDAAIVGEPTGGRVVRAQSGLAVLEATWTGRACHAAHVASVEHDNALHRAATEIAALPPFLRLGEDHPLLGPSVATITTLVAGRRHNVVADKAVAEVDARIAPPVTGDEVLAELARRIPGASIRLRSDRLKAVETAADHPLVVAALAATGQDRAVGSNTLSDMALLADVPAIKCGPGETVRSHTPDEHIHLAEIDDAVTGYLDTTRRTLASLRARLETTT